MQVDWQRLFPDENYRFHMGLRPGDPGQFFRPTDQHATLLAERCRWLATCPTDHAALEPQGADLLAETIELAAAWDSIPPPATARLRSDASLDGLARCTILGQVWEPDFLLLHAEPEGPLRLVGGVVCFPSGWALQEKLGHHLTAIHGVVPRLNDTLDRQIQAFFRRLAPGDAWERANWGLAASPELNRHPRRALAALNADATPATTWVRIEHQIFVRLPRTRGVLFGIRVTVHLLAELVARQGIGKGLRRALDTMPPDIAAYKGCLGSDLKF